MKHIVSILLGSALMAGSSFTMAACPQHLNADQMYDCIVVEGAGGVFTEAPKTAVAETAKPKTSARNDNDNLELARAHDKKK